jgi:hypothetical protein
MTKRKPGRKIGRPRKAPGAAVAHQLSPRMKVAISAIVEDNKSRAEAAEVAGLTEDAIRYAMRDNPVVRQFYTDQVKALLSFAKARAAHALIAELTGPNAAARVAAARTILEDNPTAPAGNGMPQIPGFAILIADARSSPQSIDVTPLNGLPMALAPRLEADLDG